MENSSPTTNGANEVTIAQQRKANLIIGLVSFVCLAILSSIIYFLLLPSTPTTTIKNITIIFIGIELLLIGLTLIILLVQIARLINLIQNEVNPLLESANQTINTLRGTAEFLTDSIADPVIKLNSYFASFRRLLDLLKFN